MDNPLRKGAHPAGSTGPLRNCISDVEQALEGKDVKDLLLNVGSGGGAAAAAPSGGAAAGTDAEAAPAEEEKEEGMCTPGPGSLRTIRCVLTLPTCREGGVRRGHGFRSIRLSFFVPNSSLRFALVGVSSLQRAGCLFQYISQFMGKRAVTLSTCEPALLCKIERYPRV
jgi:hypothetical protein